MSGLGRAPVLVAIALIEMGMQPLDAIAFIRERRRGAFNKAQITYLVNRVHEARDIYFFFPRMAIKGS